MVGDSINRDVAFMASRYDRGEAAYLNCPMNREQYLHFWQELCKAEQAELKDFERETAKFLKPAYPSKKWPAGAKTPCATAPSSPWGYLMRG